MRNIEYTVDINGISPATKQFGGVQGDHKVTKIVFNFSEGISDNIKGCYYRFDVYDGEGGMIQYGPYPIEIEDSQVKKVTHCLEHDITKCGGTVRVVLVITKMKENETEFELYSFPAILTLKSRPEGRVKEGEDYTSSTTLAESIEKAVENANVVVEAYNSGKLKGEKGDTGPQGPQGLQGVSGIYVGTGEMPEGYNVQIDPDGEATVLATLEAPSIVSSVDEMTDTTKHYINRNTGTLWAYIKHTKTTESSIVPNFTNVFNAEAAMIGYRWSSSSGGAIDYDQGILSDFIACDLSSGEHTIRIKNGRLHGASTNAGIVYFTTNSNGEEIDYSKNTMTATEEADGIFAYKLGEYNGSMIDGYENTKYIRCIIIQMNDSGNMVSPQTLENAKNIIITIDEEITYTEIPASAETYYEWADTGIPYAPTLKTDLIGVLGEGNVIYLSDNLPSGTYTLKYGDETYDTIGTITVE